MMTDVEIAALAKAYWIEEQYHTRAWAGPSYYPNEGDHLDRDVLATRYDVMPDEAPYSKALVKAIMRAAVKAVEQTEGTN